MPEEDQLGRTSLVREVVNTIVRASRAGQNPEDASQLPASRIVSIVGEWGSGKSWILERIRPVLGGVTREFNPWLFSGELGVYRGFASLLIDQVEGKTAKAWLAETLEFVGPALQGGGFDLSGSAARLAQLLDGNGSPTAIRARISNAMSKGSGPTYVLIDDIDRLTPDELLALFKLLRLVGDIPGFIYVMAYDEETLLHLMARTEIAHASPERARKYLDKIVETKILLPPLSNEQKRSLMASQLVDLAQLVQPGLILDDSALNILSYELETLTWRKLSTVRVIERYLDAVCSLSESLYGEVNFIDWAFVCYLRVVEPQVLQLIVKHSDSFTEAPEKPRFLGLAEADNNIALQLVRSIRETADSAMAGQELLQIVVHLFPSFSRAVKAEEPLGGDNRPDSELHVGHPEFFPRYFQHELPPGVVSDKAIRAMLQELGMDPDTSLSAEAKLRTAIADNPYATIQAISRHSEKSTTALAYFRFLSSLYAEPVPDATQGRDIVKLAETALRRFDVAALEDVGAEIDDSLDSKSLLSTLLREYISGGSSQHREWMEASRKRWFRIVAERLVGSPSPTPEDAPRFYDAQYLREADFNQFAAIAAGQVHDATWTAEGALSVCIDVGDRDGWPVRSLPRLPSALKNHLELGPALALHEASRSYPPEWEDEETFRRRFEGADSTPTLELANYMLTNWDSVVFAD